MAALAFPARLRWGHVSLFCRAGGLPLRGGGRAGEPREEPPTAHPTGSSPFSSALHILPVMRGWPPPSAAGLTAELSSLRFLVTGGPQEGPHSPHPLTWARLERSSSLCCCNCGGKETGDKGVTTLSLSSPKCMDSASIRASSLWEAVSLAPGAGRGDSQPGGCGTRSPSTAGEADSEDGG